MMSPTRGDTSSKVARKQSIIVPEPPPPKVHELPEGPKFIGQPPPNLKSSLKSSGKGASLTSPQNAKPENQGPQFKIVTDGAGKKIDYSKLKKFAKKR